MSNNYFFIFTALLLFTSIQAKPEIEKNDIIEEMKEWVREKMLNAVKDIKNAEESLKEAVQRALDESHADIEVEHGKSLETYQGYKGYFHPDCYEKGLKRLTSYNSGLPKTFVNYANVNAPASTTVTTPATTKAPSCVIVIMEDVGMMLYKSAGYISSILTTMDDIINGYSQCADNWWKKFTCLFTYTGTAISDLYHTLTGVIQLIKDIKSLSIEIKDEIAKCKSPKLTEIRQQMAFALNEAQICTNMLKPIKAI